MTEVLQAKTYLARVRFSEKARGPWTKVAAISTKDAAEMLVFEQVTVRNCGGHLPVEVVEAGSVAVHHYWVDYKVSFRTSVRDPNPYTPTPEEIAEYRLQPAREKEHEPQDPQAGD